MKISKAQLRQIIQEAITEYVSQASYSGGDAGYARARHDQKQQASAGARQIALGYLEATKEDGESLIGTSHLNQELADMEGRKVHDPDIAEAAKLLNRGVYTHKDIR